MRLKAVRKTLSRISPKLTHSLMYRRVMDRPCNLKNPVTFNEKLSWLKLNALPKMPLAILVTDKYRVRDWVFQKGFGDTLVRLVGVWNSANDVPFDDLPEKFVLKCNHGCGMNIICADKATFDSEKSRRKLDEWMHTDWALLSAEPHYSSIERKVICEEYFEGPLSDYKFYCFGGKPCYYYVSQGLENGPTAGRISFFEMDGLPAPFVRADHEPLEPPYPQKPAYFEQMEEIARELSKPFRFARIDFLTNSTGFRFSEVTLTPCAGMMPIEPKEWDYKLGEMLVI